MTKVITMPRSYHPIPSLDDHPIDDLMCPVFRMETVDAEMNFFGHDCAASIAND
jgi:hypothetical protein